MQILFDKIWLFTVMFWQAKSDCLELLWRDDIKYLKRAFEARKIRLKHDTVIDHKVGVISYFASYFIGNCVLYSANVKCLMTQYLGAGQRKLFAPCKQV